MLVDVRKGEARDVDVIAHNVLAMANDGRGLELDPDVVNQGVTNLLKQPALGFYVVAEIGNKVVGSLVVLYEWSDWRNGFHWWTHSIYVQPEFRGKGVYPEMFEFVKKLAINDSKAKSLNLTVSRENKRACAAYEKVGMVQCNDVKYTVPNFK